MPAVPTVSSAQLQAVADPQVKAILRTLLDANAVRSGDVGSGDQAFLTRSDLTGNSVTARAIAAAMARPIADAIKTPDGDLSELGQALQNAILSSPAWQNMFTRLNLINAPDTSPGSLAYQLLAEAKARGAAVMTVNTAVQKANESIATTKTQLTASIKENAAAILTETSARADAVSAVAETHKLYVAATKTTLSGMQEDLTIRANSDNALARALNTMWTRIGATTALVQTGSEIVANNVGAVVTKFEQLQAVTTDPVTGLVAKYTALRTEYNATADKVSGMSAKWSVKLDLNGYISGLSLNAGVTPEGKSESAFLVLADKFAVGAPGKPGIVPFAIDATTGLVAIDGNLLVKKSITAASGVIGDAAITNAHIKNAAVDTLKIGPNSVIVPGYMSGVDDGTNYYAGTLIQRGAMYLDLADTASIVVIANWQTLSGIAGQGFNTVIEIAADGATFVYESNGGMSGFNQTWSTTGRITLGPGRHIFTIKIGNDYHQGWYRLGRWAITILGVMR